MGDSWTLVVLSVVRAGADIASKHIVGVSVDGLELNLDLPVREGCDQLIDSHSEMVGGVGVGVDGVSVLLDEVGVELDEAKVVRRHCDRVMWVCEEGGSTVVVGGHHCGVAACL